MTTYERMRILIEPFLPVLPAKVRREVRQIVKETTPQLPELLDIGGRKSPYTLGISAQVTILDLPRKTEIQEDLHLGLTQQILHQLRVSRSNIKNVVLQDMTQSTLPSEKFDGAVCVEVIEHVSEDAKFLSEIARVLKPGGWLYMTTPNGDYIKNEGQHYNPDHLRHYTRQQLVDLLSRVFEQVTVKYGVKTGKFRFRGLKSINPRRPVETVETMVCNLISHLQSRNLDGQAR
jgi:SAM-dependent methyltransferase